MTLRVRLRLAPAFLAALLGCTSLSEALGDATRRILIAVVDDRTGQPIGGLRPADLTLEEAGVSCEIRAVETASYPLALVLDTSSYARTDFRKAQAALQEFVEAVSAREVAVYTSGATPALVQGFTSDAARVSRAIANGVASPNGSTHTLETIVRASQDLARRNSPLGAIVALSAGGTEMYPPNAQSALRTLISNHTILDVIEARVLRLESGALQTDTGDVLRALAERTHGRHARGADAGVYSTALKEVARQLESQAILEYVPSPRSSGSVSVRVKPPGLVVMAFPLE